MADGYIDIDVKLNDAPAKSQADKIGKQIGEQISESVDSATQSAKKSTNQALGEISASLSSYGAAMSKSVTLPILAAATASGAAAIKIDTALTGVRKTVDGTEQQYEALKDAAIEFSKTNAVDPAQILDIQALGAQLGYSIEELDLFSETISGISLSSNLGAEEAATELAQFANIMGMSHDETKNFGSALIALGNNFATTEADISHMAMRIAGAGKQIGLSEADVLGLSTALSSMGIAAEAGGTAISTIMSSIDKTVAMAMKNAGISVEEFSNLTKKEQNEIAKTSEALQTWAETAGMSAEQFAQAWGENAVDALSAVLVGMDNATQEGGNMAVMLDELGITAIRQTDTLKRLASNSEFLGEAVDTANRAWDENIALDKEVENRNNSIASQLQILWNQVQAVAIEVGVPLMQAVLDILELAQPLIDMLASGAKSFGDLDEEGQKTVLMAVGLVAAIGPVTSGLGKLLTTTSKNSGAWSKFAENLRIVKDGLTKSKTVANESTAAFGKYFAVQKDGVTTVYKVDRATGEYVETNSKLAKALATSERGVKVQNAAIKTGTAVMNTAKVAAKTLGSAMLSIAPMAVVTAIVAIADHLGKVKENAEKTNKATEGLSKSFDSYKQSYDQTADGFSKADEKAKYYTATLSEVREASERARDSQAELAEKLSDMWSEVGTNNAMVDEYMRIIKDLTDGYDENGNAAKLTREEQAKLQSAVEGLNKIMGTSYSIVDAENGVLNENIDVIQKSADAWKDRALAEAAASAQADLMKQHLENQIALDKAERNLKDAQNALNAAMDRGEEYLDVYNQNVKDAEASVNDLKEQDKAVTDEMDVLNDKVAELSDTFRSSVDALTNYINGTGEWSNALKDAGVDVGDFTQSLSNLGISTDDLAKIMSEKGTEGINNLINAYKNGDEELLKTAQALSESANEGLGSADTGETGKEQASDYAQGVASGESEAKAAGETDASAAADGMQSENKNAENWGFDLGSLFASGIRAAQDLVSGAANFIGGIVSNILGHSVPKEGILRNGGQGEKPWGKHLVQNVAQGMLSAKKDAIDAADEIAMAISDEMQAELDSYDAVGQIEASLGKGRSAVNLIAQSGGISNSETTWNINQPIATLDELMREQRMREHYMLAGDR